MQRSATATRTMISSSCQSAGTDNVSRVESNSNKRRRAAVIIHPLALSIDPPHCLSNKISLTASSIIVPRTETKHTLRASSTLRNRSFLRFHPLCCSCCCCCCARAYLCRRQYSLCDVRHLRERGHLSGGARARAVNQRAYLNNLCSALITR